MESEDKYGIPCESTDLTSKELKEIPTVATNSRNYAMQLIMIMLPCYPFKSKISHPNNPRCDFSTFVLYSRNETGRPLTSNDKMFHEYFQQSVTIRDSLQLNFRSFGDGLQFSHVACMLQYQEGITEVAHEKNIFKLPCSQSPSRYYQWNGCRHCMRAEV